MVSRFNYFEIHDFSMVYKHAYLKTLLLLHYTFMLSVVKMPLKEEVAGHALNKHGNYIVNHGTWNCVLEPCLEK